MLSRDRDPSELDVDGARASGSRAGTERHGIAFRDESPYLPRWNDVRLAFGPLGVPEGDTQFQKST